MARAKAGTRSLGPLSVAAPRQQGDRHTVTPPPPNNPHRPGGSENCYRLRGVVAAAHSRTAAMLHLRVDVVRRLSRAVLGQEGE